MILLNGITGFNGEREEIDEKQFKSICFSAIKKIAGSVLSFDKPEIATNFYKVKTEVFNEQLYIVLNSHYPFIAFASLVEYGNTHFIDHHQLGKEFNSFYRVLTTNELHEPLTIGRHKRRIVVGNINDLNTGELQQLWYWRPKRVGDVIFNFWD